MMVCHLSNVSNVKEFRCNFTIVANYETKLLFSSLSFVSSLIAVALLCFYYRKDNNNLKKGSAAENIVLFIGVILSVIANLSYEEDEAKTYFIYEIVYITIFGIFVTWFGWYGFFVIATSTNQVKPIGDGKANISKFILFITVPIGLIELFLTVGYLIEGNSISVFLVLSGLSQKILQAGLYHFSLRLMIPAAEKTQGASWYFKIMALFNFSMWLESISIADKQGSAVVDKYLHSGYSVFTYFYAALLIDYRLLCSMLFVEHAISINKKSAREDTTPTTPTLRPTSTLVYNAEEEAQQFKVHSSHMAGCGYFLGGTLLATQLINAFQYTVYLGPWTNIFGIAAEIMVIIPGLVFIHRINQVRDKREGHQLPNEMDVLVTLMGTIGLVFWFLKGFLTICWAVRASYVPHKLTHDQFEYEYLSWNSVRFSCRIVSIIFQLYLFSKSDLNICCKTEFRSRKSHHFLLACITLALLSVVVNSMIDAYSGFIEKLVRNAKLSIVMLTVYDVGAPVHLGFAVHMFLYFLIVCSKVIDVKLAFKKKNRRSVTYIDRVSAVSSERLGTSNDDVIQDDYRTLLLDDNTKKYITV